ncbi:MAG: double-strand break repair protein AddB [Dichotomicrobium sp.]
MSALPMPDAPHPALFTIPPERPFLADLAGAILSGDLPRAGGAAPEPLELADTTIFLPTRRACAALRDALVERAPGGALLLPRIRPLGAVDETGLPDDEEDAAADVPRAVPETERWLTLAALVQRWSRVSESEADETGYRAVSAAAAGELALELMTLLDTAQQEGVDLSGLDALVPEELAEHWQRTSRFLSIVTRQWPEHLREQGLLDPVARRNLLLARQAEALAANPEAPVIIAGSTGSVPATAALMKTVMGLPAGAIVLPGLDRELDEESWTVLAADYPQHPQAGLARLLENLQASRESVGELRGADTSVEQHRRKLISEVMRPAGTADGWPDFLDTVDRAAMAGALDGVSLLEAPDTRQEAEVVALMMRETIETPGRTAALVTPDRTLARRVRTALQSWRLDVADSAGEPLSTTPVGRFMELIARVAVEAEAVSLLALLKHPFTRLGWEAEEVGARVAELEILALRQPWFSGGLDGLDAAVARAGAEGEAASELAARLRDALAPLNDLTDAASPEAWAAAHLDAARRFAAAPDGPDFWRDAAGEAMAGLLESLARGAPNGLTPDIAPADYPGFFAGMARRKAVYPDGTTHPRLFIWGPLEARLQHADRLILGGLNDGVWPRSVQTGPWINRAMRTALGLPEPERQIGLSAHDFAQGLAAPEVVLTRPLKADGAPTVPSRWVSRLRLLADALGLGDRLEPAQPWLDWAALRTMSATPPEPPRPPAPCPPVAARPRALSVSDVESWMANPYAIYASRILDLHPVDELGRGPDDRQRGQIVHDALARFAERFPARLPDDPAGELAAIADELMAEWGAFAHVRAFWRPRFARFAEWFAETEPARRAGMRRSVSEVPGRLVLDAPGGAFTLSARADRVDIAEDGAVAIYDYKTGRVEARKRAAQDLRSPQLPLEGLIALSGGFELPGAHQPSGLSRLAYISAYGGQMAGDERALDDVQGLSAEAGERLAALIARYDDPATPYPALRRPAFAALYDYDDYAHLARVPAWQGAGDGE